METKPSKSLNYKEYRGVEIKPNKKWNIKATSRQEEIPGFDQSKLSHAVINLIGAGGLGGEIGEGLARKGIGYLNIFDDDIVELSNLNRQRFYEEDLGEKKAICLAKNLVKECIWKTIIIGYPYMFEEIVHLNLIPLCDLAICGVDSNASRKFISSYYYEKNIPVIFTAVSEDANHGYVFVQKPDKSCFGCAFPEAIETDGEPCPGSPAVKDILKTVSGIILMAVDTILMKDRNREWNFKEIFLDGSAPDGNRIVERSENCLICKRKAKPIDKKEKRYS